MTKKHAKFPSFSNATRNMKQEQDNNMLPQAVAVTTQYGTVRAEPLSLHLVVAPSNTRIHLKVDPFTTYAQLKQLIAASLGIADPNRVALSLCRLGLRKKWTRFSLQENETIVSKLGNHQNLRVEILEVVPPAYAMTGLEAQTPPTVFTDAAFSELYEGASQQDVYHQHAERQDAEYAMRLQQEECGTHHDKIVQDKNPRVYNGDCNQDTKYPPVANPKTPQTPPVCQVEETLTDYGQVILRGTQSQYDYAGSGGGESACTTISLVAARHLLLMNPDSVDSLNSNVLDRMVAMGVEKHSGSTSGHSNVEELWSHPAFEDQICGLKRGPPTQLQVGFEGFYRALDSAWTFASLQPNPIGQDPRVAVILTKSPETVLCFACRPDQWYLLDSHGESHSQDGKKVIYMMKFESTTALALALQCKFPKFPGSDEDNWQTQMYNFFETTPIVASQQEEEIEVSLPSHGSLTPSAPPASIMEQGNPLTDRYPVKATSAKLSPQQKQSPSQQPSQNTSTGVVDLPAVPVRSNRINPDEGNTAARPAPSTTGQVGGIESNASQASIPRRAAPLPEALELDMFHDPIMNFVMADPVVCASGITFDRTVIERHFQTRRDEEEARIRRQQEEARIRRQQEEAQQEASNGNATGSSSQEGSQANNAHAPVCCSRARRQIELTCPWTQKVVTDILVPNQFVEKQIVNLVESDALNMSPDDLADWHKRREEKKVRDRERAQEEQRLREEHQQRQRNREEARRRRAEEVVAGGAGANNAPANASVAPAELVRVERRNDQLLSESDLGISVPLCDKSEVVPFSYVTSTSRSDTFRCWVACCSEKLAKDSASPCARCGRLVCKTCLGFHVTDFAHAGSHDLQRVCAECVMQIADVMPREGAMGQSRAFLLRVHLQPYMEGVSNRAIAFQDNQAKANTEAELGPGIRQLEFEIQDLVDTRDKLKSQIRDAEQRAEEAKQDNGASTTQDLETIGKSIREWEETCEELTTRFEELEENEVPDDEEAQLAHFLAVSEINTRLEEAQTSLVEARSRLAESQREGMRSTASVVVTETNPDMSIDQLQEICETLQRKHQALQEKSMPEDEEAVIAHITAISDVTNRFDVAQAHLLEARTRKQSSSATSLGSNNLSSLIEKFVLQAKAFVSEATGKSNASKRSFLNGFRRRSSSAAQPVPSASRAKLLLRLDVLLERGQNYSTDASISSRQKQLSLLLNAVQSLSGDMSSMNDDLRSQHRGLLRETTFMHESVTNQMNRKESHTPNKSGESDIDNMDLDELQREYLALCGAISGMDDVEEITTAMMRMTAVEQHLEAAQNSFFSGNNADATHEATDSDFLDAIGQVDEEWTLPLKLDFPPPRMKNELDLLKNALAQNLPKSQRKYDNEFTEKRRTLTVKKETLEDEIQELRGKVQNAEASAEAERNRLEARRERHRREELARQERERARLEEERRAQEAERTLKRQHARDEEETRRALANAVGQNDNATAFGGRGDLRMCRECKTGPIENIACSDLTDHNDTSTRYKGNVVASTAHPNHCPHCGWFDGDWHNWPMWDGVFGPH